MPQNFLLPAVIKVAIQKKTIIFSGPYGSFLLRLNRNLKLKKAKLIINYVFSDQLFLGNTFKTNIKGITRGFVSTLELIGVGYKSWITDQILHFQLGYSHLIKFKIPKEIKLYSIKGRFITLSSWNFQMLFWFVYLIRSAKKPDVYKGKGVRYKNEILRLKDGKKNK